MLKSIQALFSPASGNPSSSVDKKGERAPLSFEEASKKLREHKLSWNEYLHQLFLHCTPKWQDDPGCQRAPYTTEKWGLMESDPFAYCVFWFHNRVQGIQDSTQLEAPFRDWREQAPSTIAARLQVFDKSLAFWLRASFACLALKERNLPVLQYCLKQHDPDLDLRPCHAFEDMANGVKQEEEPELYKMIEASFWRQLHPRPKPARHGHPLD